MNKKLRIALLTSNFVSIPPQIKKMPPGWVGAIELGINNLVNELVKRGHRVTLFASGDSKTKAKLFSVVSTAFLNSKTIPTDQYMIESDCFLISRAIELARKKQFDIIHSHFYARSCVFIPFSKVPILTTLRSPNIPGAFNPSILRYYSKHYPKKQYFVSISKRQGELLRGVNFIGNVYHGIDLDKAKFSEKKGSYLAFLSRIVPQKGLDVAIKVAKKLETRLEIRGSVPEKSQDYYEKKVKPFIDGKIIKPPVLIEHSAVYEFLSKAKVLLCPIKWEEAFGRTLIEAMACGTPVIAFNRGSIPEIIKDGKTGFIVNNVDEMIKAVKKIDQIDRRECRKHVERNFTIEKMVDNYEKIYQKILKEQENK